MPTPDYSHAPGSPVLIGQPGGVPTNTPPGVVAGASAPVAIDTPRAIRYHPPIPAPTENTMHTPSLSFAGKLTLDQVFGIYRAPVAGVLKSVQLFAQVAPEGADIIIDLVDAAGASLNRTATLPAGESWAEFDFPTPLNLLADAIVRAKVAQIGSTKPGSFLTCTLVVQILPPAEV